ncbi:MAG: DUF4400 domain-containing protein [Gammaproteobacteria bacterium]|nr:DUF4400 domain-containing protein [Gammaproteobacteria bacterium]
MFTDKYRVGGLLWLVKWAAIVLVATLVADCLYVMWPYPGEARGAPAFEAMIDDEWQSSVGFAGERLPPLAYAIHDGLRAVFFEWTGLDYLVDGVSDADASKRPHALMARLVLAADTLLRTAAAGLQLFSLRLGVLALGAPFVGLVATGAAADGLVTWYWRRTGGGRESGFVFHRAKRTVAMAALGLCFAYLVPPVSVDGRIAIASFALVVAIALRLAVGHFKKYI